MQKTVAIINIKAVRENARFFKERTGAKLCAVVKANAYGHGAEEITNALSGLADSFAVALIEEGLAIKPVAGGKEILVFSPPTDEEEACALILEGFTACVVDFASAKLLTEQAARLQKRINVHLKINTGMNRYGLGKAELEKVCRFLAGQAFVRVSGVFSHLYTSKRKVANKQRALFVERSEFCRKYFPQATRHLSATFGALLGRNFSFDMVRVGIGLYGYLPCGEKLFKEEIPLQKAMRVYAKCVSVRRYFFGGAGYGELPVKLKKQGWLSLLRVGYADGFLRKRRNGTNGAEKNANNLCMDICLRKGRAKKGEWIAVMTDADAIASQTGTISYEVLCAATRRAEFRYVYEEFSRR